MGQLIHMPESRGVSHIHVAYDTLYLDEYKKALRREAMRPLDIYEMIFSLAEDVAVVEKLDGRYVFAKGNIIGHGADDYFYMRVDNPFKLNDIYIKDVHCIHAHRPRATALVGIRLYGNCNGKILKMIR